MSRILIGIVATLALLLGAAPAEAAPKPPPSVAHVYYGVSVVDADGSTVERNFIGRVTTNPDGTKTGTCTYGKYQDGTFISDPDGQYVGPYTGATTASADIKQFCVDHYADRIPA